MEWPANKIIPKYKEALCFVLLLICLIGRSLIYPDFPLGFEGDEIQWIISSAAVAQGKSPSAAGVYSAYDRDTVQYPAAFYLGAFFYKAIGYKNIQYFRYFSAFVNFIAVIFFYLSLKEIFSRLTSVLISIAFCFSNFIIILSRVYFGHCFVLCFYLISLFFLLKTLKKQNWKLSFLSGAFISLALNSFNIAFQCFFAFLLIITIDTILEFSIKKYRFSTQRLKILLIPFFFLLVPCIFVQKWKNNVIENLSSRSYTIGEGVKFSNDFRSNLLIVKKNTLIFKQHLLEGQKDYLFSTSKSSPPLLILYLSVLGILISLFYFKKYYPFIIIFFAHFVLYTSSGILIPRAYTTFIPTFFILAAISIETIQKVINKYNSLKLLFIFFSTISLLITVIYETKNFSFSAKASQYFNYITEHNVIYQYALHNKDQKNKYWLITDKNEIYKKGWLGTWKMYENYYSYKKGVIFKPIVFPDSLLWKNFILPKNSLFVFENNKDVTHEVLPLFNVSLDTCDLEINQKIDRFIVCKI